MTEQEIASPAEILYELLLDMQIGSDSQANADWPLYISFVPAAPDNAIVVYDTAGEDNGRLMATGERIVHPGVQVRIRAANYQEAYRKAKYVSFRLAEVRRVEVVVSTARVYIVHNISQPGDIMPMGLVTEGDRNNYNFTVNVMLTIEKG